MNNVLVLQSGGPTAVVNASLVGVIKAAKKDQDTFGIVYGSVNGVEGIVKDQLIILNDLKDEDLDLLRTTPSAYLGTSKYSLEDNFLDEEFNVQGTYADIYRTVKNKEIGYIVVIGGNDSMEIVSKLDKFFKGVKCPVNILGIPKTIDNDMVITDHSPGYGSALKYVATQVSEIKLDTVAYDNRVTIVEVRGRKSGWLTAGAKLASLNGLGPDLIYLPEVPFDIPKFLEDVKNVYENNQKALVVVSDGIKNEQGRYLLSSYSYNQIDDARNFQQNVGGTGKVLARIVNESLNIPVRSIELQLMQRCSGHLMSKVDFDEAYTCGKYCMQMIKDESGKVVVIDRDYLREEYAVTYRLVDADEIATKIKEVPLDWIINGNDVSSEFIEYAKDLIAGMVDQVYENNLPKFFIRKN